MEKDRCKLSRPIDGDGRKHLKLMISIVNIRSFNGKLILHFVFVFFFFELLILKLSINCQLYCIYLKALVVIIISKKSQLLRWSKLDNHLNKLSKFLLNGTNNEAQTENSCLKIVSITPFFYQKISGLFALPPLFSLEPSFMTSPRHSQILETN